MIRQFKSYLLQYRHTLKGQKRRLICSLNVLCEMFYICRRCDASADHGRLMRIRLSRVARGRYFISKRHPHRNQFLLPFWPSSLQAHRFSIFSSPSWFSVECLIARKFARDDRRATIDQPHLYLLAISVPASSRLLLPSRTPRFPLKASQKTIASRSRTSIEMQTASVQSIH